jgi:hypothetical protein
MAAQPRWQEASATDGPLPRILSAPSAARLGLTRAAVRHGIARYGWQQLARGIVLTSREGPTRDDWAFVGMEIAGRQAALSGWDAVRIVGLGATSPPSPEVLVLDRRGEHRLIGHVRIRPTARPYRTSLLPGDHPTLPYLPIVHPARAIADVALYYRTFAPVRALVTSAVQKKRCDPSDLVAELEAGPRNGSGHFRSALSDVLDGAQAVDVLRRSPVPAFELNVDVLDASGRLIANVDVLWRELRAVAEIDGRTYHSEEEDWQATLDRHNVLNGTTLALGHYTPRQIRSSPRAFAAHVEFWLRNRARELGVPYVPGGGPIRSDGGPPPFVLPFVVPRDQQLLRRL